MFNDPAVDEVITINGKSYRFIQVPDAPGIVYAELGKKAKVYSVRQGRKAYALKVFKPAYRSSKLVKNTSQISAYSNIPGLSVAERFVLTPEQFPDLISDHPEFSYAVLMPWIEGKSWTNYIVSQSTITTSESLRLASTFAQVIYGLEERNLAHCDLSGANFIFSTDFNHVELVDIEELYSVDMQLPNPIPAGTSGYSPEWVKENGLWDSNADRFAAGVLISEILGWQFEDIRTSMSKGDAYFKEGELCHESKRYKLLTKRLKEIHPKLAELFQMVWQAKDASECPRISEWMIALKLVNKNASPLQWGWESLDLLGEIAIPERSPEPISLHQETYTGHNIQTSSQDEYEPVITEKEPPLRPAQEAIPLRGGADNYQSNAQPWPVKGKSRKDLLMKIFLIFTTVGIGLLLLILIFGNLISEVSRSFREQSGWILVDMISNSILGLAVGSVQAWIFKNNISKSHIGLFILSALLGGAAGGALVGFLTNTGDVTNAFVAGAVTGSIGGSLSSLAQNMFMRSQGFQIKWFVFSLISWIIIWLIGTPISWSNQTIPGIAGTAALIIIASGAALSLFLHQYPEIEF